MFVRIVGRTKGAAIQPGFVIFERSSCSQDIRSLVGFHANDRGSVHGQLPAYLGANTHPGKIRDLDPLEYLFCHSMPPMPCPGIAGTGL